MSPVETPLLTSDFEMDSHFQVSIKEPASEVATELLTAQWGNRTAGQQRLEQLRVKLAKTERAKQELAKLAADALRRLEEEAKHRAAVSARADSARKDAQRSKMEAETALAAVKGLEHTEQLLKAELAAENLRCTKLREEVTVLQRMNAISAQAQLESASNRWRAQREAQSQVEALEKQVSTLQQQLADLNPDGQQRAQREAQSQVEALEKQVLMLQQQLADKNADDQCLPPERRSRRQRLEQLEATIVVAKPAGKELAEKVRLCWLCPVLEFPATRGMIRS